MSLNVSSIFSNLMSVLQRSSELETHHNIGYIALYHNSFFTWLFGKKHFVLDNQLNYCYISILIDTSRIYSVGIKNTSFQ